MRRLSWLLAGLFCVCAPWAATARADDEPKMQRRIEIFHGGGAFLGVALGDVSAKDVERLKLSEERGALVRDVIKASPAEKAGLKTDDVVLRYQGEAVTSAAQFSRLVGETPAGRKVALEVSRGGSPLKLTATLGEQKGGPFGMQMPMPELTTPHPTMPPGMPEWGMDMEHFSGRGPRKLGIEYREISGQLATYFKLGQGETGLLIEDVDTDGPAGKAGLRAGDVLVKLGDKDVRTSHALRRAVADLEPGASVTATVVRDGKTLDLKVTAGGEPKPKATKEVGKVKT